VTDSWASSLDLHLNLPAAAGGRRAALERALRAAIRDGRLRAGERIPSTRALAHDLGLARGTVAEAYAQLAAEGYLRTSQGAPTRVAGWDETAGGGRPGAATGRAAGGWPGAAMAGAAGGWPGAAIAGAAGGSRDAAMARAAGEATAPSAGISGRGRPARLSLRPGVPDVGAFPRSAWVAALRRALNAAPDAVLRTGDPRGRPELRAALAAYLGRARGVPARPDRIVITAGFTQGFALLCRAFGPGTMALEDPCLHHLRDIARAAGLDVAPLAVDERGAHTPDDAVAALVTPAHQFPLGATLAPERRAALVAWARERSAIVIEDDYDGEFRYDRQPVGALQGLDAEHVIYAGTASKTLAPGLRLGWLVLPERLVAPVVAARPLAGGDPPVLDQLALAGLIASGGFDRHVRRMRQRYRRRRDALLEVLAGRSTRGVAAGLHLVLDVDDEDEIVAAAAARGLALDALGPYWHDPAGRPQGLVLGYAAAPEHAYAGTLATLRRSLPR
jgi:GntR family transcriptional regulator/MocR family aminotransferase